MADEQLTQAKSVADWLGGTISVKHADRAHDTREEAGTHINKLADTKMTFPAHRKAK